MIKKMLRRLPVRLRGAILFTVLASLVMVPLIHGMAVCFWEEGFKRFPRQVTGEYKGWWSATKTVYRALITGEEQ